MAAGAALPWLLRPATAGGIARDGRRGRWRAVADAVQAVLAVPDAEAAAAHVGDALVAGLATLEAVIPTDSDEVRRTPPTSATKRLAPRVHVHNC
jgi:hypothetical protein